MLLSDFDELDQYVHPANLQVLASSPIPAGESQSDLPTYGGYAYSDMTYYSRSPGGAGIFDSGTNNWIPALDTCRSHTDCPAPVVDDRGAGHPVAKRRMVAALGRDGEHVGFPHDERAGAK